MDGPAVATPRRRPWLGVAIVTALAWAAFGVAATRVADGPQPGTRIADGVVMLILVAGLPILRLAGRRAGLQGRREWFSAAAATLGLLSLGIGFAGCVVALLTYG